MLLWEANPIGPPWKNPPKHFLNLEFHGKQKWSVPTARLICFIDMPHSKDRGLKCIIAGAGGAAHLPGMTASMTTLPVLGVPVKSRTLNGVDSILSIVQMPAGIPTATFAVGEAGATNAALFAVSMLAANGDGVLCRKVSRILGAQQKGKDRSEAGYSFFFVI